MIQLQPLPFKPTDLEPYMSAKTIEYHYNHHHAGYVKTVNKDIAGTSNNKLTLRELMRVDGPPLFVAAVHQVYNHEQFWSVLTAEQHHGTASPDILSNLSTNFGGWQEFKTKVLDESLSLVGSGWLWVVLNKGNIEIHLVPNAVSTTQYVLFVIDLWEHAYYLDTPANKKKYIDNIWNILNWNIINDRYNYNSRKI